MAQPLVVYPQATQSTTLGTASQLLANPSTAGSTSGARNSLVGTATGFGELWSTGNVGAWAGGALNLSIAPTGHGFFLDTPTLDGMLLLLGVWSGQARVTCSANTATVDLY